MQINKVNLMGQMVDMDNFAVWVPQKINGECNEADVVQIRANGQTILECSPKIAEQLARDLFAHCKFKVNPQ